MQCYSQPWLLLMPRPGISARQSTPSRNRFRKRVQPATRMPSPWVKGFSPLFSPTHLSAKIQTGNNMELPGNGVMNHRHNKTTPHPPILPFHNVNRGHTFVLAERDSSIRAGTDQGIYTRDTHSTRLFWLLRGEAVLSCRL